MSVITQVTIANIALSQLGAGPIGAFTDSTQEAQLCGQYYPLLRDAVLEDYSWSFAIGRVKLQPLSGVITYQYDYAYSMPVDSLRILSVSGVPQNLVRPQNTRYAVENGYIVAMDNPIYVEYTKKITNTNLFSASFKDALACRMAADMCIAITNSRELAGQMRDLYDYKVAIAARNDGLQGSSQRMPPGSLVTIR